MTSPRRTNTSANPGRPSTETGSGARKAGLPAGGTTRDPPAADRAARSAVNAPSASPIRHPGWASADLATAPRATATTCAVRSTRPTSPPNRPTGPRTPKAQIPGRCTSTHGVTAPRADTTPSKQRASRASSRSSTRTPGHRDWASRLSCPRTTPARRAAIVVAATCPANNTRAGSPGPTPWTVNGQSGHRTTRVRGPGVTDLPVPRRGPAARDRPDGRPGGAPGPTRRSLPDGPAAVRSPHPAPSR